MTQVEFDGMMQDWLTRQAKKPASSWAQGFMDQAKKDGITDGTAPQSFATKEMVATMIMNAAK